MQSMSPIRFIKQVFEFIPDFNQNFILIGYIS